jgi:ribulose-phosphate 3-epimerase
MREIAPSILSSTFLNLQDDIQMINDSEANWIHIDVMDGRFVPNISFGMPIIKNIRKVTNKLLDVHLMIVEPEKYISEFVNCGADLITVHYEACGHLHRTIQSIKDFGKKAAVAINPHTPISVLEDIISELDMVLIMSVNPGFSGQKFIENTYKKILKLRQLDQEILIQVDGGVTLQNSAKLFNCGANILVAGNTVFSSKDPKSTISSLKKI